MSSTDLDGRLSDTERQALLDLARDAISRAAHTGEPLPVAADAFSDRLRRPGASFVSIHHGEQLRGCIGHLEARQPLCVDVGENAHAAASLDRRFEPIRARELSALSIEISVLGTPRPLPAASEQELLDRLRPGVDGLILQLGERRATFLPVVWRSLGDPAGFVRQLKLKAGLPVDYWSASLQCLVYQTECIAESD